MNKTPYNELFQKYKVKNEKFRHKVILITYKGKYYTFDGSAEMLSFQTDNVPFKQLGAEWDYCLILTKDEVATLPKFEYKIFKY